MNPNPLRSRTPGKGPAPMKNGLLIADPHPHSAWQHYPPCSPSSCRTGSRSLRPSEEPLLLTPFAIEVRCKCPQSALLMRPGDPRTTVPRSDRLIPRSLTRPSYLAINNAWPVTMATATDAPAPKVLGVARRTFGMALLLLVVVLWTASNFLGSVCSQFLPGVDKAHVGLHNRSINSNI